jgi:hypothetical protein
MTHVQEPRTLPALISICRSAGTAIEVDSADDEFHQLGVDQNSQKVRNGVVTERD